MGASQRVSRFTSLIFKAISWKKSQGSGQPVVEVKSIAHPADQAILSYLCDKDPSNSLLISGKWGAGKTHYLTVRKEQFSAGAKKKFILISVAGLATREELDQALFMASAPWLF
ncbi:MAG TPA: P-loop NTPase fold protein, partial [Rhodanobacter sp.]|nr:P-loop NTPase fold protein [Rhodanobacter sp.]